MSRKLTLDLDEISVESYATTLPQQPAPENLATCLLTACGKIQCCA